MTACRAKVASRSSDEMHLRCVDINFMTSSFEDRTFSYSVRARLLAQSDSRHKFSQAEASATAPTENFEHIA